MVVGRSTIYANNTVDIGSRDGQSPWFIYVHTRVFYALTGCLQLFTLELSGR